MFDFVDLFAGIGGFHAALSGLGGRAVQAAEIDQKAAKVYEANWGLAPDRDVRWLAADADARVKNHAVLTGGFPCQPFSKSGRQLGIAEDRGVLFQDIIRILEVKRPPVVMLENVRNLASERQRGAWTAIISGLRAAGYKVSSTPCIYSPHLLSPELGGAPQSRERVYIMGVYVGATRAMKEDLDPPVVSNKPTPGWDPQKWSIAKHVLLPEPEGIERQRYVVSVDEVHWIDVWNELLVRLGPSARLPGFPMWEPTWRARRPTLSGLPVWKQSFIRQNHSFYLANRRAIDAWRRANRDIVEWPLSRRKLEWQAQDGKRNLWHHLIQLRPSGIRVKRATWTPALVAMYQTPIYGPSHRRLTEMEAAVLQGFDPTRFSYGDQATSVSYRQMGNAVNVGVVRHVLGAFVDCYAEDIAATGDQGVEVVQSVLARRGPSAFDAA